MRLHILAAALAALAAGPALAQDYDSPSAMLKAFYKPYIAGDLPDDQEGFRSEWLNSLYQADEEATPAGEMGAIEFDPYIDGQDYQITDFNIDELEVGEETATVEVTFKNMGQPTTITYDLVYENNGWRIDDLEGENADFSYRLSEIFEAARG
ncbi:hypothetical protein VW35_05800 [Devosia soli]|uniref:DUF3828 domain-containing protein n=1 Tax=Devosia soli TaxID=361041 RepID=A0A0F5LC56_9HYPH|nr:DUF3828 domain-containing protein [Devosia soli]KKB79976.1 hypothetical protein VW35_05800 [Devosia soli]